MTNTSFRSATRIAATALTAPLALALAGCAGGIGKNSSLDSIHQPVVQRTNFTFDVNTGSGGLSYPEQRRLAEWFDTLSLRYGDRVSIDDPMQSDATRSAVQTVASRYGLVIADGAPVTPGHIAAGTARIVLSRSSASVKGCPNWTSNNENNFHNAGSSNYGCAVNSNLAAMVADPEHLLKGAQGSGETVVMSSNKAIDQYRTAEPTGKNGLSQANARKDN